MDTLVGASTATCTKTVCWPVAAETPVYSAGPSNSRLSTSIKDGRAWCPGTCTRTTCTPAGRSGAAGAALTCGLPGGTISMAATAAAAVAA